jgi:uncharacterized protein
MSMLPAGVILILGVLFFAIPQERGMGPDDYFEKPEEKLFAKAIANGDEKAIDDILLNGNVDLATLGKNSLTFLTIAIHTKQRKAFALILKRGALGKPASKTAGQSIYTATLTEDEFWLRALLQAGADPNNYGGGNLLAVHALNSRIPGRLELYMGVGIDLEAKSVFGGTLAIESARLSRFDVTNQILKRGASIWAIDGHGITIGFKAEEAGRIPGWRKGTSLDLEREKLLHDLREAGFPDPAPLPEQALQLLAAGNWPIANSSTH